MKKSTIITAAILGGAALYTAQKLTADFLMKLAMDRDGVKKVSKKGIKLVTGVNGVSEYLDAVKLSGEKLKDSKTEHVEIRSVDGLRLVGHWRSCDNPKRVIVMMHGWRSSWYRDAGMISDFLEKNGCCVLYAEQRAQGESDGEYMTFGISERFDCRDWVLKASELSGGKLPIYLYGVSMGGTTVLMTGGFSLPSNVAGIISDCAFTSPVAIWKHIVEDNLHMPFALFRKTVFDIYQKRLGIKPDCYSTLEAMKSCKLPILFIHGSSDHFVPTEMTFQNYGECRTPKELLIVPGADHGMSLYKNKEAYEKALCDFWNLYDGSYKPCCNPADDL